MAHRGEPGNAHTAAGEKIATSPSPSGHRRVDSGTDVLPIESCGGRQQEKAPKNRDYYATTSGRIDITGIAEALVLAGPGNLTLTLEDGRRLAFDLTNSGGGIVGRGWLPE